MSTALSGSTEDLRACRATLDVMAARGGTVGQKETRLLLLGLVQAGAADAALAAAGELHAAGHVVGRAGFHALLGGGAPKQDVLALMAAANVEQTEATRKLAA